MSEIYIGLMSGTSLDGIDGVLMDFSGTAPSVLQHCYHRFAPALANEFLLLNTSGGDELHRAALAANALARAYADVVADLLAASATDRNGVVAIGAHGQTVRHCPQEFGTGEFGTGYTLQLNNPALLAELTGIDVVADFRSRDVAAGGQGAPLVPAFHQAMFGGTDQTVTVLNIGGISNISVLAPTPSVASDSASNAASGAAVGTASGAARGNVMGDVMGDVTADVVGFDCGPGNALMDRWCQEHTGQAFDDAGRWAATGRINDKLLKVFLDEPYFAKPPPKSTGRDLFNVNWLASKLASFGASIRPVDVQATLAELTAVTCAASVSSYGKNSKSLIVCGGGAFNTHLLERIQAHLPGLFVMSSQACGLPPMQVEAAAFAWLAAKAVNRHCASLPKVTGAKGARILGAIYPA